MKAVDASLGVTERLLQSLTAGGEESAAAAFRKDRENRAFTVTISREVGARGNEVAAAVGKQLNWPVYDQEIIHKVAEAMGQASHHVRSVDEKHFSWLEDVLSNLLDEYHVNPSTYLKYLVGTLRGLALEGRCVILGRAGSFILPPETTLRVRLVAARADRIRHIGRLRQVSDREAEEWIDRTEKERILFVTKNFHHDPADVHNYDVVLNTSRVPDEDVARIVVETLRTFEVRRAAVRVAQPQVRV